VAEAVVERERVGRARARTASRVSAADLEQSLLAAIDPRRIREDLDRLGRLSLRLGGTEQEREAAGYVCGRLRAAGVDARLEELDAFVSHAAEPSRFGPAHVEVRDASPTRLEGKIYAFSGTTPQDGVVGELVDVGIGSEAEYVRLGVDVRGKIALSRLSFDAPHSEPARVAQSRGAAGLVVSNWSGRDGRRVHTSTAKWTWGNPTPDDLSNGVAGIPIVAVAHEDGELLRDRLRLGPTRVAVVASSTRGWTRTVQPIAEIEGATDAFVLLHCHLDAFGAGATDNATGIAGLMELARVLNEHRDRLRRSVRIAWWACHEMPYDGSTWHLDRHWDTFRAGCVAALNADSWALAGSAGRIVALTCGELEELARGAIAAVVGEPLLIGDFSLKEAEQTFWSPGISSGFVFSATRDFPDGPITGTWFHTEFDTLEHVDDAALAQLVQIYALMAARLAAPAELPLDFRTTARRVARLLDELAPLAPPGLELASLADLATPLEAAAEASVPDESLLRAARALNPALYTVAGPYGQDPVAAVHLGRRLPGLRVALEGLAAAGDDTEAAGAWLTVARRERNRVSDALREAVAALAASAATVARPRVSRSTVTAMTNETEAK
jgi:N-acetylated-alpha-linked acidic dipeptidase